MPTNRTYDRVLGMGYAGVVAGVAVWLADAFPVIAGVALALTVAIVVGSVFFVDRPGVATMFRSIAVAHIAIALLAVRIAMTEYGLELSFFLPYVAWNVLLPGLFFALLPVRVPQVPEGLPAGYEHVATGGPRLTTPERVAFAAGEPLTLSLPPTGTFTATLTAA